MASPVPASGSSSGSTSQGSSQNTSASRRTRSVGTKLTDEEYTQLESLAAAQGLTPGEWVRELVLRAFGQPAAEATVAEQTVLSEVLALRTILINIIYDQANGYEIAPERMRGPCRFMELSQAEIFWVFVNGGFRSAEKRQFSHG
jgi:hypothetical protein